MYGNKADNLITLKTEFGDRVPDFAVFSDPETIVFRMAEPGFLAEVFGGNSEISDTGIAAGKSEAIGTGNLYAVRSSTSLEDSAELSFAGQFDTYLNVPTSDVKARIADCFASLKNASAQIYKNKLFGAEGGTEAMFVIVQRMVPAETAGVVFGANPQGILNEAVISVAQGLGEQVVGGKKDTVNYYLNLTDRVYYYEDIAECGKNPTGGSNCSEKDNSTECSSLLSREQLLTIADDIERVKKLGFTYPDMEIAIADGIIYLLQVRKITTLSDEKELILDNSNIVESYPGLSLPLTISFVNLVYGGVFRDVSRRVLKNDKLLAKQEDIFYNMVGSCNGRVYYKISNWYALLLVLPMSGKIIPIWQEMMGVRNKSYDKKLVRMNVFQRMMTYINSLSEFVSVPKNMDNLEQEFAKVWDSFRRDFHEGMEPDKLWEIFEDLRDRLFSIWGVTLLNDMYAFVYTGLLKKRLSKKYGIGEDRLNGYMSGISNIESLKPITALIDLAYDKDGLTEEEYKKRFDEYIALYGDRSLEELKLESRTFRANPALLTEKVNKYRKDPDKLKEMHEKIHISLDSPEIRAVSGGIKRTDFLTRNLMKKCAVGIAGREKQRLNRSRIYGFLRSIMDELGRQYVKKGCIQEPMDVYYLTLSEVKEIVQNPAGITEPYLSEIKARKEKYDLYEKLPAYSRLIFAKEEFDKNHRSINSVAVRFDTDKLCGIPCSEGIVEGEALVITDVTNTGDVSDKILITEMTDPGWVFLLATAKGVISRKGSLLSHTAIISRELKLPSIVGVKNLTETIESGDRIRMNGGTGEIEILKKHSTP